MAVMRKKGGKETPAISTASLPDIIFMLIFFFMVSTSMREVEQLVRYSLPPASEAQKLEKKTYISYILVGPPITAKLYGTTPRIQLNDSFRTPQDIGEFVASERDKLDEIKRHYMTISLKADRGIHMGIVSDIKQELRRANSLKIVYASDKYAEE